MTLTTQQRRDIRKLAATAPLAAPATARAWLQKFFEPYGSIPPPYRSWIGARRERSGRWARELLEAAEAFASNRARLKDASYNEGVRRRRRVLKRLAAVCDDVRADPELRRLLYLSPERGAATPLATMHQVGMLVEKAHAEGVAVTTFATFDAPASAEGFAAAERVYLCNAVRPGAWARDAVRDLSSAARAALTHAPFRRDKIDDTRDQFTRRVAEAWEFATATPAKVHNLSAHHGRFCRFMADLFEIVGDDVVSADGLAHRIRRARTRAGRGLFM